MLQMIGSMRKFSSKCYRDLAKFCNENFDCRFILLLPTKYYKLSGVFIVNFEHISHLFLVFLLLTLNIFG